MWVGLPLRARFGGLFDGQIVAAAVIEGHPD
jgi:hypothetical protein